MRKFISMLLAVLMLGALAVPAMAEGPSPNVTDDDSLVDSKTDGYVVKKYDGSEGSAEELVQEATQQKNVDMSDYAGAIVVEVEKSNGESTNKSVTVVITYKSSSDHVAKILYKHGGNWEVATFTYLGNGQYQVTFAKGLSPVVLLLEPGAAKEPTSSGSSSSAPKSPKTGYD